MATVPSPRTWAVGELLTAAKLNTDLRDGLNFLLQSPIFVVRAGAPQSIPYSSPTLIQFPASATEEIDSDNGHSPTTNNERYVAQTAGWFHVNALVGWDFNATGGRTTSIAINGTIRRQQIVAAPSNTYCNVQCAGHFLLNVGDYVTIYATQTITSAAALNTFPGISDTPTLEVRWVRKL